MNVRRTSGRRSRSCPNRLFPQPHNGFNVHFFEKAFRAGDPALGGVAGYRLVQVRLADGT